jgi:hypothetical protein
VLLHYPALWVGSTRGFAPLHAAAVQSCTGTALLAGPGGVGRSTLLMQALRAGAHACGDNLCASDGRTAHGLVEPVRMAGVGGRRMPHDRGECVLPGRVGCLVPDRLVLISRRTDVATQVQPVSAAHATRVLEAGTYAAGELRRYWSFAATLALGTGRGPAHPPVKAIAGAFARLPTLEITLGAPPPPPLDELITMPSLVQT